MMLEDDYDELLRFKIKELLVQSNTNVNVIAGGNLTLQRRLNGQINEGRRITAHTLYTLLCAFPRLSADRLMRGDEM